MEASNGILSAEHDVLLMDLDGVCYLGALPAPFAAEGMAAARKNGANPVYITNNSSRPPQVVADQLTSLDLPTEADQVLNSAQTGVMQLAEHVPAGSKVLAVGGVGIREALADAGFEVVESADDAPVAVLQGLSHDIGWAELSEAVLAINAGALFVATNLDATLPKERGLMIGNGSLVAAVQNATGVTPLSSGKPAPDMYRLAVKKTNAKRPLAVGDRLNTDIAGANAAGYPCLHVLTGVSQARDIMLAIDSQRPTYLGMDLRDLNTEVPAVEHDGEWHVCEGRRAKVSGDSVEVEGKAGSELTLNEYRAAVSAVWAAIDAGKNRDGFNLPEFTVVRD